MHGLSYNGHDIQSSSINYSILDTGTSLLYIGQSDYTNFIEKIMGDTEKNGIELNCQEDVYCFSDTQSCD